MYGRGRVSMTTQGALHWCKLGVPGLALSSSSSAAAACWYSAMFYVMGVLSLSDAVNASVAELH